MNFFTIHKHPLFFPAAFASSLLLLLSSACGPPNSSAYRFAVKIDPSGSERGAADPVLVDYKSGGNIPAAAVPSSDRPASVDWVALEAAAHETTVAIIGKYMHAQGAVAWIGLICGVNPAKALRSRPSKRQDRVSWP